MRMLIRSLFTALCTESTVETGLTGNGNICVLCCFVWLCEAYVKCQFSLLKARQQCNKYMLLVLRGLDGRHCLWSENILESHHMGLIH